MPSESDWQAPLNDPTPLEDRQLSALVEQGSLVGIGDNRALAAQNELTRRLIVSMEALRDETAGSSRTMQSLTTWLVVLTVLLVILGGLTVWAALAASSS